MSTQAADSRVGLWLLNGTGSRRFLGRESSITAVSASGRRIAYWNRNGSRLRVVVSDDAGRNRRVVLSLPGRAQAAPVLLSADGRYLLAAFHPSLDAELKLVRLNVATRRASPTTIRCAKYGNVSWAPDASRIACASPDGNRVTIVDANARPVFSASGWTATWLSGGRIAVSDAPHNSVTLFDHAGRRLVRYDGYLAATSRDGRLLALSGRSLRIVDERRRIVRTISRPSWTPGGSVSFSPGADEIAYADDRGRVHITEIRNGTTTQVLGAEWRGVWTLGGSFVFTRQLATGELLVEAGDHYGRRARVIGRSWVDDHGGSEIVPLAGNRVVFFSEFRSHADLWVVHSDGSGLRRLTTGADISGPAWSPRGDRLAYIRADGPPSGNCGFCPSSLTIASPTGQPAYRLVAADGGPDLGPTWSPDGNTIAVEHNWELIQVVPLATERRRQVGAASAHAPAWSPNRPLIAYVSTPGIRAVSSNGTHDHILMTLKETPASIAWSADGRDVAFATTSGIYVAAVDGSTPPRRLPVPAGSSSPSFSPDGRRLAFAGRQPSGLYVIGVDGSGLQRVVPFVAGDPAWRP